MSLDLCFCDLLYLCVYGFVCLIVDNDNDNDNEVLYYTLSH